ncbi:ADP-ribosylhydrolase ARH3-like isoform X2 [Lycorma delicatula]|uniref:ADP-ribosylhydrolase ARH3-like isoform X2 n=1 Tax=Lycorma delicatula TaxID=130591 RepID=UPI003F514DD7
MAVVKDSALLANKFRGCLVGALLGDCLGAPYEGEYNISKVVLQKYFDKLEGPYFASPVKPYTDDTAMTKCVAESLIAKGGMDQKDLADRFTKEYFKDPRRGYGMGVVSIFHKLRNPKLDNVLRPAEEQFDGQGSFGNGGAMRIAPVALFGLNNYNNMLDMAKQNTLITHSNILGINGALLQCIALYQCLHLDPKEPLDVKSFTTDLKERISAIENNCINGDYDYEECGDIKMPYHSKLEAMEDLLKREEKGLQIPDEEVNKVLGTSVTALHSVPTAIYCFLRAQKEIPGIESQIIELTSK